LSLCNLPKAGARIENFIETAGRCFGASLNDIRSPDTTINMLPSAALEAAANGVDGDTGAASIHVSHSSKL